MKLVLFRNNIGHKLEESCKVPYKIKNIYLRNNVTIVDKENNKEQVVHKTDLSYITNSFNYTTKLARKWNFSLNIY